MKMITAEEARNNDQLYFSNSYKTALSLYLKPEDNYSELIDLIDRSVGKQSCVGKYAVVVTLIAGWRESVKESIDVSKSISFLIFKESVERPALLREFQRCRIRGGWFNYNDGSLQSVTASNRLKTDNLFIIRRNRPV